MDFFLRWGYPITVALIVLVVLSLTGCGAPISKQHFDEAEVVCEANDGLHYIYAGITDGTDEIYCNNGAVFDASDVYGGE